MLLLSAICLVLCASTPYHSFFHVVLPHIERTITVYVDVVASATITILKVSNTDDTIPYLNASSVQFVDFIYLSKKITSFI